ncbi:hypothetical protein GC175_19205 [bacterium]|nr:hypothetical protein [bacterium]
MLLFTKVTFAIVIPPRISYLPAVAFLFKIHLALPWREEPPMEPVRVVVIADASFVLEGITNLLMQADSCEVMSALLITEQRWPAFYISPHVVLIHVMSTPPTTVCRLIEEAKRRYPRSALLIIGTSQPSSVVASYINAGANGILHHEQASKQLVQAIQDIAHYGLILDASTLAQLQQALRRQQSHKPLATLTAREQEIIRYAVKGRTNSQIATELNLSINTVKTHLRNAYEKLNITNRAELAVLALSSGMTLSEGRVAYLA